MAEEIVRALLDDAGCRVTEHNVEKTAHARTPMSCVECRHV
jgi:hypothetical protein